MQIRTTLASLSLLLAGGAAATAADGPRATSPAFTADFGLEHVERFVPDGSNAFMSLRPGHFLRYEGVNEDGAFIEIEVSVLERVRRVPFVVNGTRKAATARVVEEREWIDGALAEVSFNYYAIGDRSADIYHFGEDVTHFENGVAVDHEGSWRAGRNGAQPGLIMPAVFLLGSRYSQENAPGVAMDRAEHLEMGLVVETPAGTFTGCVAVSESSPLEPDEEVIKLYAPGVGPVVDDFLTLVEYHD